MKDWSVGAWAQPELGAVENKTEGCAQQMWKTSLDPQSPILQISNITDIVSHTNQIIQFCCNNLFSVKRKMQILSEHKSSGRHGFTGGLSLNNLNYCLKS